VAMLPADQPDREQRESAIKGKVPGYGGADRIERVAYSAGDEMQRQHIRGPRQHHIAVAVLDSVQLTPQQGHNRQMYNAAHRQPGITLAADKRSTERDR